MPYNIAAGNSSGYNYSSGRLDHLMYYRNLEVDRAQLESIALDRIFAAWLQEAGYIVPSDMLAADYPHRWLWPAMGNADPEADAKATAIRLLNYTTTFSDECQKQGVDPESRVATIAADVEMFKRHGLPNPYQSRSNVDGVADDRGGQNMQQGLSLRASAKPPEKLLFTATPTFDLEAQSADGKPKRPTFSINAYTGATMSVGGFYSPVIVDLAGLKAGRDKIPILLDHDMSKIVGQTDSIAIDSSGVRLTGSITGEDANASSIVTHARNGFEWQASIGAAVVRQEFLKAGEKAVVNSREVSGPLTIVREARLYETSFVAVGADGQTSASVAASESIGSPSETEPTMQFEAWLKANGFEDPAALSDSQRKTLQALYDQQHPSELDKRIAAFVAKANATAPTEPPKEKSPATTSLEAIFENATAEESRISKIGELTAQAVQDYPGRLDELKHLSKLAIESKMNVAEFELNMLRLCRRFPAIQVSSGNRMAPKAIEAALCRAGGLNDIEKHFDAQTLEASDQQFRHGLGLRELLSLVARENGHHGISSGDIRGLLEAAFTKNVKASGFSTLSIPGILSNTANKFSAQGFNAVESSWRSIYKPRSVRDFKAITSYSLTGSGQYELVPGGGEIPHGTLGEESYTNKADTYGKMFGITRKDIINDDLGALSDVPMKLGRGAALALNDVFWTEFLADLNTFYSVSHANVSTGSPGSLLSSAGLKAALQVFRKQTDPDGKPLGILPRILLVPPELEITADELMSSTVVNTGGSSTSDKVPNSNVWRSKFQVVMSTYLSNTAYTGSSTTAWFLIANPADLAVIEVAFLNGREQPIIETADADFNTLGIQMRGYHDFGVSKQEYRASVRSAGA